jgi:hypothetical protein
VQRYSAVLKELLHLRDDEFIFHEKLAHVQRVFHCAAASHTTGEIDRGEQQHRILPTVDVDAPSVLTHFCDATHDHVTHISHVPRFEGFDADELVHTLYCTTH